MQPSKTFHDFIRTTMPYIGPMFGPPWWELPAPPENLKPHSVPAYIELLFRAACKSSVIVLEGSSGLPAFEIGKALCSFWGIPPSSYYSAHREGTAPLHLIDQYCQSRDSACILLDMEDVLASEESIRRKLSRACVVKFGLLTQCRLLLTVTGDIRPYSSKWSGVKGPPGVIVVKIPTLEDRPETIIPWFMKYLAKHTGNSSPRYLQSAVVEGLFGWRCTNLRKTHGEHWIEIVANSAARDSSWRCLTPHQEKWIKMHRSGQRYPINRPHFSAGPRGFFEHINPRWVWDLRLGCEYSEKHPVGVCDARKFLGLDVAAIYEHYEDYVCRAFSDEFSADSQFTNVSDSVLSQKLEQVVQSKKIYAEGMLGRIEKLAWKDVTITFVSDDAVKIQAAGIKKFFNFGELGFTDRRKGDQPDSRWKTFRDMARVGEISWEVDLSENIRRKSIKAIQDINGRLKEIFRIDENPIPHYRKKRAYRPKFKLVDGRPPSAR